MDVPPTPDLLESAHSFPGPYKIKAIGKNSDDFAARLLTAVRDELGRDTDPEHSVRSTQGGRHVAVTLDVHVVSAEQVRRLHARIHAVEGLLYLL